MTASPTPASPTPPTPVTPVAVTAPLSTRIKDWLITIAVSVLTAILAADHARWKPAPAPNVVVNPPSVVVQPPNVVINPPAPQPQPAPVTPAPAPAAPASPLVAAVQDYRGGLAGQFAGLAAQVRSGTLRTKADIAAAARKNAKAMSDAMVAAVDAHSDASGNISDSPGLAAALDQVAQALGGN